MLAPAGHQPQDRLATRAGLNPQLQNPGRHLLSHPGDDKGSRHHRLDRSLRATPARAGGGVAQLPGGEPAHGAAARTGGRMFGAVAQSAGVNRFARSA